MNAYLAGCTAHDALHVLLKWAWAETAMQCRMSLSMAQAHLLAGCAVHDALVVLEIHGEGLQVPVVDAQHHSLRIQIQPQHALQLCSGAVLLSGNLLSVKPTSKAHEPESSVDHGRLCTAPCAPDPCPSLASAVARTVGHIRPAKRVLWSLYTA